MSLTKFALASFALCIMFACTDMNKSNQLKSIENMHKSLDSISTVLKTNEIDTIAALQIAANGVELRIKTYYKADTIDMAFGKKMDAYKVMRRTFSPLGRMYNTIKKGAEEQKLTLNNLKADIENGDGERDKYDEYISFEENKVNQLRVLLKDYVDQKTKTMKTFHELHDELNAYSLKLVEEHRKQNPQ